jgi:hypothetical protein
MSEEFYYTSAKYTIQLLMTNQVDRVRLIIISKNYFFFSILPSFAPFLSFQQILTHQQALAMGLEVVAGNRIIFHEPWAPNIGRQLGPISSFLIGPGKSRENYAKNLEYS